jgi:hypothetical protein
MYIVQLLIKVILQQNKLNYIGKLTLMGLHPFPCTEYQVGFLNKQDKLREPSPLKRPTKREGFKCFASTKDNKGMETKFPHTLSPFAVFKKREANKWFFSTRSLSMAFSFCLFLFFL